MQHLALSEQHDLLPFPLIHCLGTVGSQAFPHPPVSAASALADCSGEGRFGEGLCLLEEKNTAVMAGSSKRKRNGRPDLAVQVLEAAVHGH